MDSLRRGDVKIGEGDSPGYCSALIKPGNFPESVLGTCIHRHSHAHTQKQIMEHYGCGSKLQQWQFVRHLATGSSSFPSIHVKLLLIKNIIKWGHANIAIIQTPFQEIRNYMQQLYGNDPVSASL